MFEFLQSKSLSISQLTQYLYKYNNQYNAEFLQDVDFEYAKKVADDGNIDYQVLVGQCYYYGSKVKPSKHKAFSYFKKAADSGHSFAQYLVGGLYQNGEGVAKSEGLAFEYYKKAADQKEECAYYDLAKCYLTGIGVEKSIEKAIQYFTLRADYGDKLSIERLIEIFRNVYGPCEINNAEELAEDYLKQLFMIRKKLADEGDARAQNELGEDFENGNGTQISLQEAFKYYFLATQQNNKYGYRNIARCYEKGLGVEKSEETAIEYYKLAIAELPFLFLSYCEILQKLNRYEAVVDYLRLVINSGNLFSERDKAIAYSKLGNCYEHGLGVKKSLVKAFEYYKISFKKEPSIGLEDLARAYENGIGTELSTNQAKLTYSKAIEHYLDEANSGDDDACYFVGMCYLNGLGVEKSIEQSHFYFLLGANNGGACLGALALMYSLKKVQDPTYEKTFYYNHIVASIGSVNALHCLGELYENGHGVCQSYEKALYYYEVASEKGNISAHVDLGRLYSNGTLELNLDKSLFHYKKAGSLGNSYAYYKAGALYENKAEYADAFKCYKLAADQKEILAYYPLAQCYLNGLGVEKSIKNAVHYFRLAVDSNNSSAMNSLADILIHQNTEEIVNSEDSTQQYFNRLLHIYTEESEKGYAEYQAKLAELYDENLDPDSTKTQAVYLYRLAAEQSSRYAEYKLGFCYENGIGLSQSDKKALKHYIHAYEYGACSALDCGRLLRKLGRHQEANEYYKSAIDNPDYRSWNRALACIELGNSYASDLGVEKSEVLAFSYYEKAFQLNSLVAADKLAKAYKNGIGVKQSKELANQVYKLTFETCLEDANTGDDDACYFVGKCYLRGLGIDESMEKALFYFEKGAKNNGSSCLEQLAWLHCFTITPGKSFHYSKIQADLGKAFYQYRVGLFYENGWDVKKSIEQAICYYKKASEKFDSIEGSHLKACLSLARLYREGREIEQSLTQAFFYYKKAADQGSSNACYETAFFYEHGLGTQKSYKQSAYYYRLAAKDRWPEAIYSYAIHLKEGKGTSKLPKMANKFLRQIIDEKIGGRTLIAKAYTQLGDSYEHGKGVRISTELAFECYTKAFEEDNDQAFFLAKAYEQGIGIDQDLEKALELYKAIAKKGDFSSAYRLGLLTRESSLAKACNYFKAAAQGDNFDAILMLAELKKTHGQQLKWKCLGLDRFLKEKLDELNDKARRGDPIYEEFLGILYENGLLVVQSPLLALHCYKSATKHGQLSAYRHLANLYKQGKGINQSNLIARYYYKRAFIS